MIRTANHEDIGALLDLGEALHQESPRWSRIGFNRAKTAEFLASLILAPTGLVLVAERDGEIYGGILAMAVPHWCSDDVVAQEVSLFVRPDARGHMAAKELIRRMCAWAKDMGAVWLQAGSSTGVDPERTAQLYEHMGFKRCVIGLEVEYGY